MKVVLKALRKKRQQRFQSAAELASRLRAAENLVASSLLYRSAC
jgi:hypothetical protein